MSTIIFIWVLGYAITGIALGVMTTEKYKSLDKFGFFTMVWLFGVCIWWVYLGIMLGQLLNHTEEKE